MSKPALSRDAQIVAISLFGFGPRASVSFRRPHIIHPRTKAGIDELKAANLIEEIDPDELPRGAQGWRGKEELGFPMIDFKKPEESECFPLTNEGVH